MANILVTGADGFLGKEVINLLKVSDFDFVGISRKKGNFQEPELIFKNLTVSYSQDRGFWYPTH